MFSSLQSLHIRHDRDARDPAKTVETLHKKWVLLPSKNLVKNLVKSIEKYSKRAAKIKSQASRRIVIHTKSYFSL